MIFRTRTFARLFVWLVVCVAAASPATRAEDQNCTCTFTGPVDINNFPQTQHVVLDESRTIVAVRETDLTRTVTTELNLGTGEKRVLGPYPLEGRSRLTISASLIQPRTNLPQPLLTVKWLVRFHADDPFFDPCAARDASGCRIGFPGSGAALRLAPPGELADLVDHAPVSTAPVTIATTQLEGTEGLLVVDNHGSGPRVVRIQTVFNR